MLFFREIERNLNNCSQFQHPEIATVNISVYFLSFIFVDVILKYCNDIETLGYLFSFSLLRSVISSMLPVLGNSIFTSSLIFRHMMKSIFYSPAIVYLHDFYFFL